MFRLLPSILRWFASGAPLGGGSEDLIYLVGFRCEVFVFAICHKVPPCLLTCSREKPFQSACALALPCLHAFETHLEACTQMLARLFSQQLDELPVFFTLEKVWKALFHGFQVD